MKKQNMQKEMYIYRLCICDALYNNKKIKYIHLSNKIEKISLMKI